MIQVGPRKLKDTLPFFSLLNRNMQRVFSETQFSLEVYQTKPKLEARFPIFHSGKLKFISLLRKADSQAKQCKTWRYTGQTFEQPNKTDRIHIQTSLF